MAFQTRYNKGIVSEKYTESMKPPDRVRAIKRVVNGRPIDDVKATELRVFVSITRFTAKCVAEISGDEELNLLLAIV